MKKVLLSSLIYILLMITDFRLTYAGTPDLAMEANPLVAVFGFGWAALFMANGIGFILYMWAAYYTFVKYQPVVYPGADFKEYVSLLFFGEKDKFRYIFYKSPENWRACWACVAYAIVIALPLARCVVVCEWMMLLTVSPLSFPYQAVRELMPFGRLDVVVGVTLSFVMACLWMRGQHRVSENVVLEVPLKASA